jgi:hypothetical protein
VHLTEIGSIFVVQLIIDQILNPRGTPVMTEGQ